MNVGQAVRERIAELCEEKHITINKLANISGITAINFKQHYEW